MCLAARRLAAHPDWTRIETLDAVLDAAAPAIEDGFAALLLAFDPRSDGLVADFDGACEAVAARASAWPEGVEVHVLHVPPGLADRRDAAAVLDAVIVPAELEDRAGAFASWSIETLPDAGAVARWRAAREGDAPNTRAA